MFVKTYSSRIQSKKILAKVVNVFEIHEDRTDLSEENELIQVSVRNFNEGFYVEPHSHLNRKPEQFNANEIWLVLSGEVEASIFDIDDKHVDTLLIKEGDLIAFYNGGHSLKVVKSPSKFIEFKSGPYLGVLNDKRSF